MRLLYLMLLAPCLSMADPYASPQELVDEMQKLQGADCDLECHIVLAGMYTERFLSAQRDAVMSGLEPQATRASMMQTFFGRQFDLHALRNMSHEEFFAHQTWYRNKSAPAEFLMRYIEIVSISEESPDRMSAVIRASGMAADPDYTEEGSMIFTREKGGWKVDARF